MLSAFDDINCRLMRPWPSWWPGAVALR